MLVNQNIAHRHRFTLIFLSYNSCRESRARPPPMPKSVLAALLLFHGRYTWIFLSIAHQTEKITKKMFCNQGVIVEKRPPNLPAHENMQSRTFIPNLFKNCYPNLTFLDVKSSYYSIYSVQH